MEPEGLQRLLRTYQSLTDDIDVKGILPFLISKLLISSDDQERIDAEVTRKDKIQRLLRILRTKEGSYDIFRKSLEKDYKYLVQKLDEVEIDYEEIRRQKQDFETFIEEFLKRTYIEDTSTKNYLYVAHLQEDLKYEYEKHGKLYKNSSWARVEDVLYATFKQVTKVRASNAKRKPTEFKYNNLRRIVEESDDEDVPVDDKRYENKTDQEPLCRGSKIEDEDADNERKGKRIKELSPMELRYFLKEEESIDERFLQKFEEQDVSGEIFLSLTIEDTKDMLPDVTLGKRKAILLSRNRIKQQEEEAQLRGKHIAFLEIKSEASVPDEDFCTEATNNYYEMYRESFRIFDTPSSSSLIYRKKAVLKTSNTMPSNLIVPVHKFLHDGSVKIEDIPTWLSENATYFIAACLNHRTNGTIHFGVQHEPVHGTIVGVICKERVVMKTFYKTLRKCFNEEDFETVCRCVRPPQFIEVKSEKRENSHASLYVVEIDVISSHDIVKDNAFFLHIFDKSGAKNLQLMQFVEDKIKAADAERIFKYMKKKGEYSEQRLYHEKHHHLSPERKELRQRFLNLFSAGNEKLSDEIYPLLFISPLDSDIDDGKISSNFEFINDLDPRAVFDFDSHCDGKGLFQHIEAGQEKIHRVVTSDEFNKSNELYSGKKDGYKAFLEEMATSQHVPWIFCNGYEPLGKKPLKTLQWKQNRAEGYKESVRFFGEDLPKERIVAIFLIMSEDNEIMLEAADEAFMKFKDQWLVMAESENIANRWMDQLVKRHSTDKKTLEARCIIGIPWNHVNVMIRQVVGCSNSRLYEIPTSTGAYCVLKERLKNELCDLEILPVNACDPIEITAEGKMLEEHRRMVSEKFYHGDQVTWWNFWFKGDQVLIREKHQTLMDIAKSALNPQNVDEDHKVAIMNLFHQPGAGGTTSAKQVLWSMKEKYRCCVVKQITDQTVDQITKLRSYEDQDTPLPPIVLIDNEDEERINHLYVLLQERARIISRRSENPIKVFCLLFVCIRRANLPLQVGHMSVQLKHDLSDSELDWFKRKGDYLMQQYQADKGINPKLLISFNILKENFNAGYIKRTVSEFLDNIEEEKEKNLLCYLSLMNVYDLDFQPIPVSAFDALMDNDINKGFSFGNVLRDIYRNARRRIHWDARLSQSSLVLLNRTARSGSHLTGLAIINPLFAREILYHMLKKTNKTRSEIMIEFLDSVIFQGSAVNRSLEHLKRIIRDILKKRDIEESGMKKKFSPLISDVIEHEGIDRAQKLFERAFEISPDDAMLAQQISRLFIFSKNWVLAEKYAQSATRMRPDNSFLWDTYGQVYLKQLTEMYFQCSSEQKKLSKNDAEKAIHLALEGIKIFRTEQDVSEKEKNIRYNDACYYAELHVVNVVLDILTFWPPMNTKEKVHKFLVNPDYLPEDLTLSPQTVQELKQFHGRTEALIRLVEEKESQLKTDHYSIVLPSSIKTNSVMSKYAIVRLGLDGYFGEENNEIPFDLSAKAKAEYRRRRVQNLGGRSLTDIIKVTRKDEKDKLSYMFVLLKENIDSEFCNAYDLITLVGVSIFLNRLEDRRVSFVDLLNWSKRLLQMVLNGHDESGSYRPYLESFLYPIMLHWPTENRRSYNDKLCSIRQIQEALKRLKIAFQKNYPRQREDGGPYRKRETTYFFLGVGKDFDEIVYYEDFDTRNGPRYFKGDTIWERPNVRSQLLRLKGTLFKDGLEVQAKITTVMGNIEYISIPTAQPVGQRTLWQKEVFFFIGFSWSGPKAYDVSLEGPYQNVPQKPIPIKPQIKRRGKQKGHADEEVETHVIFQQGIASLEQKIKKTKTALDSKSKSHKQVSILRTQMDRLINEKEALMEKRRALLDIE